MNSSCFISITENNVKSDTLFPFFIISYLTSLFNDVFNRNYDFLHNDLRYDLLPFFTSSYKRIEYNMNIRITKDSLSRISTQNVIKNLH